MIRRGSFLLVVLIGAFLTGCASADLAPANTAKVRPGETTYDQVVQILGRPKSSELNNGRRLMHYIEDMTSVIDEVSGQGLLRSVSFDVLVDENGVVEKVHRRNNESHVRVSSSKGTVGGSDLSDAAIKRVNNGVTTFPEMVALFGQPGFESLWWDGTIVRTWFQARIPNREVATKIRALVVEFDDHDVVFGHTIREE